MGNPNPVTKTFKKTGIDANPNGAPDGGHTFKAMYERNVLTDLDIFDKAKDKNITVKELLVRNRIRRAVKGSEIAQDRIEDRVEGKVVQPTDLTTGGEKIEFGNLTDTQLNARIKQITEDTTS